jgi:plasmid replication initiation protein
MYISIGQHYFFIKDESKEMMDEYVNTTQDLLENPYNAPFQEDLSRWENKLTTTKSNIELWFKLQQEWLEEIEPQYRATGMEEMRESLGILPKYKMFEKLQRIWKRLIRCVKSNPIVSRHNYINFTTRCIFN